MKVILAFVALAAVLAAFAPVSHGVTICDTYAAVATGGNSSAFMDFFISAVMANLTAPNSIMVGWFNSSVQYNGVSTLNFLVNPNKGPLYGHLANYFGNAIGCDNGTWTTANHPFNPDMAAVHAKMGLRTKHFNMFKAAVYDVAVTNGVTLADAKTVGDFIEQQRVLVVKRTGVCDKYSDLLDISNNFLMNNLVATIITNIATNASFSALKPFFDATIKYKGANTDNFVTNSSAAAILQQLLVTWFGKSDVLGCTDVGFAAYTGPSMGVAHANMGITVALFNQFVNLVGGVSLGFGVSSAEVSAIATALNTYQGVIVATVPAAAATPGVKAPTSATGLPIMNAPASVTSILISVLAVLIALVAGLLL